MDLKKELEKNSSIILSVPSKDYNQSVLDILKQVSGYSIHYVTLNKTSDSLTSSINKNSIGANEICYIDGITKTAIEKTSETKGTNFLNSPDDLEGLKNSLMKDKHNHEIIVIDSLSTLLIYKSQEIIVKFIKDLLNKVKSKNIILIVLQGDKEKLLVNELKGNVDKIIELK